VEGGAGKTTTALIRVGSPNQTGLNGFGEVAERAREIERESERDGERESKRDGERERRSKRGADGESGGVRVCLIDEEERRQA